VLIVDTGPLVATADRADKDHEACRQLLESDEGPLVTTAMVIAEAAYLIDRQLGAKAEASLYASIIDGQLEVADLGIADWQRIQDLVSAYADLRDGCIRGRLGRAAWRGQDRHTQPAPFRRCTATSR
jgi:predicted nucleic acid-binding protein